MRIDFVTIFPDFFTGPLGLSIPARAVEAGLVEFHTTDLREYTHDRHRSVDDEPYGGGAGMVMKPAPFFEAIDDLAPEGPIILVSARGRPFVQADAERLALEREVTFLCGHYKDVDQRVADHLATEELSLGDFVVSGGEYAALAMADAIVRLLPGALGDPEAAETDSFHGDRALSAPSYTRPAEYRGYAVPEILLSGDHARIAAWREEMGRRITRERRPDLDAGTDATGLHRDEG
ncbi:MAG: tRNA (guanosine(37)-N1)-methyltransferase TrmD [Longimicrobiales bacterium]|nr:tRNA (guanosine(37)-N1)-methyltransferase TrmD [Longimicrobiales bacterium]